MQFFLLLTAMNTRNASFPKLNLPKADLRLREEHSEVFVWCIIRKKHLLLTPEEWVRQHVIHFLITQKKIPIERIGSEIKLAINGQNRRCDLVILDAYGQAYLIIECKAPEITLDEKTFLQVSNYVQKTNAPYFMMSNGIQHIIMACAEPGIYLDDIPPLK